jgi:deazaflavin-dependent oxidoreductase (nitroreductase family)
MPLSAAEAEQDFCYVTTAGRRSGKPHTIEIWFGHRDGTLYMLSGGGTRSDWVRNIVAGPAVTIQVRGSSYSARGRIVEEPEEEALARRLLAAKYQGWRDGQPMSQWAATALPVALDLDN